MSTVKKIFKGFKGTGSLLHRKSSGRPKIINERTERHLVQCVRKNPFANYNQLRFALREMEIIVCRATVISCLKNLGFGSYIAAHKPALTERHKQRRLQWSKDQVNWTDDQWRSVVWSDESRFTVEGNDGGARVIRQVGERYQEGHIVPVTKWGKGSPMIWSCFWAGGFGPLVFLEGNVNQDVYVNTLAQNFLPWAKNLSEEQDKEFILQEDGASCHTGPSAKWWKEGHAIKGFEYWPAKNPDINPIEHVWWALEVKMSEVRASIQNVTDLKVTMQQQWQILGTELASRLVGTMQSRCQAVIDVKGSD